MNNLCRYSYIIFIFHTVYEILFEQYYTSPNNMFINIINLCEFNDLWSLRTAMHVSSNITHFNLKNKD